MTDTERALTGLQNLRDAISNDYIRETDQAVRTIDDAIELLKEQEPKAIEYHDNPFTGLPVAHCPNCMRYARQFYSSIEEETHYCPWCGQAVKWDERIL